MIRVLPTSLLLLCCCCVSGCALLKPREELFAGKPVTTLDGEQVSDFETDAPVRRIVRMQSSIATARSDDRRLRSRVWEELDEAGPLPPQDRRRLNQSGIRVGVTGASGSWVLSSLLGGQHSLKSREEQSGQHSSAMASNLVIPEESNSLVHLPSQSDSLFVPPGEIAGLKNGGELKNGRRIIQVEPIEYGNGWVLLRFLPQLHFGNVTTRLSVSKMQSQLPTRQRIQPLYEQQFELKLHVGEIVVIGHEECDDWTVGKMMFRPEALSTQREHLLALQLSDIEEVVGEKSMTVDYSRY